MKHKIKLGITLGDINGIGPEIALKAAYQEEWSADSQIILLGPHNAWQEQAKSLGLPIPQLITGQIEACNEKVLVWSPGLEYGDISWSPGSIDPRAAKLAHQAISVAAAACLDGTLDAMVTAPICKEGFDKAGINVPGHTELLAELTGSRRFAMLLSGGGLRVLLATRHLPLKDVPAGLTQQNIEEAIELAAEAMPWLGVENAVIGVCALNPHAGDGGLLGSEEIETIQPAIDFERAQGIEVSDPVPADVMFHKARRGDYGIVVAMYHDQGLGPLKMMAFDEGINVTLGLPIVRTSPDHGTAFDIAGQGKANPSSMIQAIRAADFLARRKNPWKS